MLASLDAPGAIVFIVDDDRRIRESLSELLAQNRDGALVGSVPMAAGK